MTKEEALRIILNRDFAKMLEVVPEGIIHRGYPYTHPACFEMASDYGEEAHDARYQWPARMKMIDAFIHAVLDSQEATPDQNRRASRAGRSRDMGGDRSAVPTVGE